MRLKLLVLCLALLCLGLPARAGQSAYHAYAVALVADLPAGITAREDMEKLLSQMANAARVKAGRKPLTISNDFRVMARAQATDMVLGDFVGHQSVHGDGFHERFVAFAKPEMQYPARGENAARDRQKGGVDKVKAARLFQQWLDSAHHRQNLMMTEYDFISTGAVAKGNHLYAVQVFWAAPAKSSCNLPGLC